MDPFIIDNDWVVDKNTDNLNRELFGDSKESRKSKRSRRKKRKIETASVQNIVQKVSLHPGKSPKESSNLKEYQCIYNSRKKRRKSKACVPENASDCAINLKRVLEVKDQYNNHECKKLDITTANSSELSTKYPYKVDNDQKLNKEAKKKMRKLHKQNSKTDANLLPRENCDTKSKTLPPFRKHKDSINYSKNTDRNRIQKKRKKKKMVASAQNSFQNDMHLNNQSLLGSQKPNNLPTLLSVTKLKDILKNAHFPQTSTLSAGTKKREKGMLILEKDERKEYSHFVRKQAVDKLKSARFRFINEKMYTTTGKEAMEFFKLDSDAFDIYHDGFQSQVDKWPINPVDIIINDIRKKPSTFKIADFGCGNANISQAFQDREVHSFDLIGLNSYVTVCDMANVPLSRESMDIVVFCLALMGTNLKDYFCEAHRVLKMGGQLKIAEVISRMECADTFINDLKNFGFSSTGKNVSHKMFIFLDFIKSEKLDRTKLPAIELKPCLYKKR